MGRESVDVDNLQITGSKPSEGASVTVRDEVIIVVNQAYGPRGDQLVGISDVTFDGFPALTVRVRADGRDEQVHLSPIHGDRRKQGMDGLADGTKCEVLCPVSGQPLPRLGKVGKGDAEYCAIYLTTKLEEGSMIYLSDTWGHHHSRVVDDNEMISLWVAAETAE